MKISKVFALGVMAAVICAATPPVTVFKSGGKVNYALTPGDESMLDSIQHKTFLFFVNEIQPEKGIIKDRSTSTSPSSIAATGFGIPCIAIGVARNWISREKAAEITLKILQFFSNSPQNTNKNGVGYKGFYYHFLNMETGTRQWNCELSTIDTGILMMGILFARNYYDRNNANEKQIRQLAGKLLSRVDWDFVEMPGSGKFPYTISMGWTPEKGLNDWGYGGYDEALFLYILSGRKRHEKCRKKL
jgi:hypothetical protein